MSQPSTHAGPLDWVQLALLTVLWGTAYAFIGVAVETLSASALVFIRIALAAAMLTAYAYAHGRRLPPLRDKRWPWMLGLGLFGNAAPFFLISWGQAQGVESALTGILVATMPIATIAIAHFAVPGERMTPRRALGFALGFGGVLILLGPAAFSDMAEAGLVAQIAIVGAAVCYALNAILARLMPDTPPSVSGAGMLIGGALLVAPFGIWDLMAGPQIAPVAWAFAFLLALGPTAFATVLLMRLARGPGPGFLAVVNYLTPIAAVVTGALIGEAIGWQALLALAVILAGVLLGRKKPPAADR